MELRPSDEQQQLIEAYAALYAKESSPERVRQAEPLGFDQKLWDSLVEMGSVGMAVPEAAGGWGASLLDIALVAQEHGRSLGAAPLIETQVAARLLARVGTDAAEAVLGEALAGRRLVTLAPRRVRGDVATLVPAGAIATDVIVFDGESLRVVTIGEDRVVPENLGLLPLADVGLEAGRVISAGPAAREAFESAVDDWLVLMANAQVGMAQRSLDIGVEYAKDREAFDQKIGGFQAVGHRLADCKAAIDGAEMLAREAAWAELDAPVRFPEYAAMAYGFATQTARDTSYWSLHFHGGYGFMLEYDIQLYYRRSRGWARVLMDSRRAYERAAEKRYGPLGTADVPAAGTPGGSGTSEASSGRMDFRLGARTEEFRAEIREFLDTHMTAELEERTYRNGVSHDDEFTRALVEQGWLAPGWPVEFGGQGRDPIEMLALHEELRVRDAPTYGMGTTAQVAAVLRVVGTPRQQQEIIPKALAGEIVIVLGFSEPEAGSDVAAAATKAVRDGDQWVINGSKMFTTNAQIGDYVFLLTRTNPDVPKHKGLTMFLVPMDQPGVEVQAVYTLSGERTNITFYNDVRVSDEWRVGEVDGGWRTMTVSLGAEHGTGFGSAIERMLRAVESWAAEAVDDDGDPVIDDPRLREALGHTVTDLEVSRLLQRRTAWMAEVGLEQGTAGPMSKLFSSEALVARAEELTEIVGPDALRSYFDPTAPEHGTIEHVLRFSLGTTIYAGTSEIHRNMIAQRGLGLPRTR